MEFSNSTSKQNAQFFKEEIQENKRIVLTVLTGALLCYCVFCISLVVIVRIVLHVKV